MTQEMKLKNGSVLVAVTGYSGESDFYTMYDIIQELLQPDTWTVPSLS